MNQIEFLLRLSENAQDDGDVLAKRQNAERDAHIKALLELKKMNDLAGQNIVNELARWGVDVTKPQALPREIGRDVRSIPHNSAGGDNRPQGRAPATGA